MRQVKMVHATTPYGIQESINKFVNDNDFYLVNVELHVFNSKEYMAIVIYEENSINESLADMLQELENITGKLEGIDSSIMMQD